MSTRAANQLAKAYRFGDWLDEHLPLDIDEMKLWGDDEWQAVTDLFNLNRVDGKRDTAPNTSRSTIIAILRERRAVADPFAGLGVA